MEGAGGGGGGEADVGEGETGGREKGRTMARSSTAWVGEGSGAEVSGASSDTN